MEGWFGSTRITSVFQPVLGRAGAGLGTVGHEALLRPYAGDGMPLVPRNVFATTANPTAIVYLDRLCRTVHMLNYLAGTDDSGYLFLSVEPRHVLSVPRDHGCYFEEVIHRCGLWPERVVIQMRDAGLRREEVYRLAEAARNYQTRGYRVAAVVEDSAVSHSGLERLWSLPPDFVKLDRSFLVAAARTAWERHRFYSLVTTIHHLGAQVLQEGIQNEEQAQMALAARVDLVQGQYFGTPSAAVADASDARRHSHRRHEPRAPSSANRSTDALRPVQGAVASHRCPSEHGAVQLLWA